MPTKKRMARAIALLTEKQNATLITTLRKMEIMRMFLGWNRVNRDPVFCVRAYGIGEHVCVGRADTCRI